MCYQDAIEKRKKRENYERKDENKRMRKNINNEKKIVKILITKKNCEYVDNRSNEKTINMCIENEVDED